MIHASDTPQIYRGHIPFVGKSYRVRAEVRLFAGETGSVTALDTEGKCAIMSMDGRNGIGKHVNVFGWDELEPVK